MKLSDVILQNADKYIQIQGDLYTGELDGKKCVCVMGLLGFELFPQEFDVILKNDEYDAGFATNEALLAFYDRFPIQNELFDCLPNGLVIANDDGQTFQQIGEKLAACGL